MTNRDKFYDTFGRYAAEIWALPDDEFRKWAANDYRKNKDPNYVSFSCSHCNYVYRAHATPHRDEEGFYVWESICPKCGAENEVNDCDWR